MTINKPAVTQEVYDKCNKYIQSSFEDVQKLLWNFPHIRTCILLFGSPFPFPAHA